MTAENNSQSFNRLQKMKQEHRELDLKISDLAKNPATDQLYLRRLKKRKLYLKDMIHRLESDLIPDWDA